MTILEYTADKARHDLNTSTQVIVQEDNALEHLLHEIKKYANLGCGGCCVETELPDTIMLRAQLLSMGYKLNVTEDTIEIRWD